MYWHIDADIISLVVLLIVFACNRELLTRGNATLRDRYFSRSLMLGVVAAVVDIAASVVMESRVSPIIYHALMTVYFITIEFIILHWLLYVLTILYQADEPKRITLSRVALCVFALYAVFCVANLFTGHIYSLGPDNTYRRGPYFFVMVLLYTIYSLSMLALILARWKHIPAGFPSGVLLATPLVIAAGIAFQLLLPGWLLIVPAYMVCMVLAFLFMQRMRVQGGQRMVNDIRKIAETDRLTGLYNRMGMEVMVQRTTETEFGAGVVVLIADIDNLKGINDTMGHAEGDRGIRLMGECIRRYFRACDTVARYGGDEFLAFFTGDFTREQVRCSLQKLTEELSSVRVGEHNDVPMHASVGAALGVVGRDSFETMCSRADIALYAVKRHGKNASAIYSPDMEEYR